MLSSATAISDMGEGHTANSAMYLTEPTSARY
jgi:hypothetical protein